MASLFLEFVLISLVAGNNLSVCVGSAIGSRIVGKRIGITIAAVGYILGLLLQGSYLSRAVSILLPSANSFSIDAALLITTLIFIIAEAKRVPQSLAVTLTAVLVGINVGLGTNPNLAFIASIVAFWIVMPLVSFFLVLKTMRALSTGAPKKHIWSYAKLIRAALIISSFATAFTLGGNTIGLILALIPKNSYSLALALVAIALGSVAFSGGTLKRVGNEIIPLRYINAVASQFMSALTVEVATLFNIPFSNTASFIAGVYGAGISYRERVILRRPIVMMVGTWVITALVGFVAGYVVMQASAIIPSLLAF